MSQIPHPHHSPRRVAAEILNRTAQKRHTLDHWLDWADSRHDDLSARDRAFIRSIVYGTIRWQSRLDWIIDQLATRPVTGMDPPVRTILRMGLFQLLFMDRVPVSAAVNTSVELAKQFKRHWAAGFINKVLRRAAAESKQLAWPEETRDPVEALALEQAFPEWMINRWIQRWGLQATRRLCHTFNTIPAPTLRTNTLKVDRATLIKDLENSTLESRPTAMARDGVLISNPHGPLTELPAFGRGWFQIQDEAAQLVSQLLSPQPGQTVWDACAGLGTKTGHLAQLMANQGHIEATDANAGKLTALATEMRRLGVTIVHPHPLDLNDVQAVQALPLFDRILLDAPCSGMGVIGKNPDIKWSLTAADLTRHSQHQCRLLGTVCGQLKSGGILVYSVCSMEPEETRWVMEDFLRNHPEFDIYLMSGEQIPNANALMTPEGWLRTIPQDHDMDGFFAAAVTKCGPGH